MPIMELVLNDVKPFMTADLMDTIFNPSNMYSPEVHQRLQEHLRPELPRLLNAVHRYQNTMNVLNSIRSYFGPLETQCKDMTERISDVQCVMDSVNHDVNILKQYQEILKSLASPPSTPIIRHSSEMRQTQPVNMYPSPVNSPLASPQPARNTKTPPSGRNSLYQSTPSFASQVPKQNSFSAITATLNNNNNNGTRQFISNNHNYNNPIAISAPDSPPPSYSETQTTTTIPPVMIASPNTARKREREKQEKEYRYDPNRPQNKKKQKTSVNGTASLNITLN